MTETINKIPREGREGRAGSAFRAVYEQRMEQIADMPVKHALRLELAYRCPICRVLHPGMRYSQENSREFCSAVCYSKRQRKMETK